MTAEYRIGNESYIIKDGCYSAADLEEIIRRSPLVDLLITQPGITIIRKTGASFLDVSFIYSKDDGVTIKVDNVEHLIRHVGPEVKVRQVDPVLG